MANSSQAYIRKDLGDKIQAFQISTDVAPPVEITNVNTVASYSWATTSTPAIVVPGSPRVWIDAQRRFKISPDKGYFNADENAARMGNKSSSLTPIFAALDHLYPQDPNPSQSSATTNNAPIDLRTIDVVCERNALRKIYRLANFDKRDRRGWRIDVELAGSTCLFTSIQAAKTVFLKGRSGCGYGYERASTVERESVETTQHFRVTEMNFGRLKVLLRYEVDACILPKEARKQVPSLETMRLSPSSPSPKFPTVSIISLPDRNSIVPQPSLLEIKTKTLQGEIDWKEIYPQLFFSQTPNLYLARHQQGLFTGTSVTKFNMDSPELVKASQKAQVPMARAHLLLEAIIIAIRGEPDDAQLALTYDGKELALYRRRPNTGRAVGPEILSRFK